MNRRGFLKRLAYGTVATAALVSLPASVVKHSQALAEAGRHWACERLRKAWMEWCAAHPRQSPEAIVVGSDLAELYESELIAIQRFVDSEALVRGERWLVFKGARVIPRGRGYSIRVCHTIKDALTREAA